MSVNKEDTPALEEGNKVEKGVSVTRLLEPDALSLVKSPAVGASFRVVRSEDGKGEDGEPEKTFARRIRRSARHVQRSAILYITLTEEATDEEISALAAEFGLTDYHVETDCNGVRKMKRSDAPGDTGDEHVYRIGLSDHATAHVLRTTSQVVQSGAKTDSAHVVRADFDPAVFATVESVDEYCVTNGISSPILRSDDDTAGFYVSVGYTGDDAINCIRTEDGVTFHIRRADQADTTGIPLSGEAKRIVETTCYGRWGWGNMSFATALADINFSKAARAAIDILEEVMNEILFYNNLPNTVRRSLVANATQEFSQYIQTLIDALPVQQTVEQTVARKDKKVPTPNNPDVPAATAASEVTDDVVRSDAVEVTEEPVTQESVRRWIAEAIAGQAALAAPIGADTPAPAGMVEAFAATVKVVVDEAIQRSLANASANGGSVVLRSDRDPAPATTGDPTPEDTAKVKRSYCLSDVVL